jgi:hypothetical protein
VKTFVFGEVVQLHPVPRTANKYTVNQGCQIAEYGLSISGTNGRIDGPVLSLTEKTTITCDVTAHQSDDQSFTATVTIMFNHFAYPSLVAEFPASSPASSPFELNKARAYQFEHFLISCNPILTGLDVNSITGSLSHKSQVMEGGVTDVAGAEGQLGGICVVKADATHYTIATKPICDDDKVIATLADCVLAASKVDKSEPAEDGSKPQGCSVQGGKVYWSTPTSTSTPTTTPTPEPHAAICRELVKASTTVVAAQISRWQTIAYNDELYPIQDVSVSNTNGGICQGDCDGDSDCSPGLLCYQRGTDDPMPFCSAHPS